jgi:signal peptidase I
MLASVLELIGILINPLSWLAIPVGLICIVDDWFLRPRRHSSANGALTPDPILMRVLYGILPILIGAVVLRLLRAERMDFSVVLLSITVITGIIWALDAFWLRGRRRRYAELAGRDFSTIPEPATLDYARSFFPVALIVLVLRSFIFEPFRIPSDSMMPTLLDGDLIVVNKYAYGLRLPVINRKVVDVASPQRGDIVVFRFPLDPTINYIKRLVGLPGDRIEIRDDRLYINGTAVPTEILGSYNDGCYTNMQLLQERIGPRAHQVLSCPTFASRPMERLESCNRSEMTGFVCLDRPEFYGLLGESAIFSREVPAGMYLMIGDNRDNSADGREWGFVPESYLVGKASRIWFNWDWHRSGGPLWSRIGQRIE